MTEPRLLIPQVLTQAAFAPFGDVIEAAGQTPLTINQGTTIRFHDLAKVDVAAAGGRPLINIFRGQPRPRPIPIVMMERHPLGSQAFYPLGAPSSGYLLVVAIASATVTAGDLVAFAAGPDQGVNYHRGVWHHPLLSLRADQDFLVVDRGGDGDNLQEVWFGDSQGALLNYQSSD